MMFDRGRLDTICHCDVFLWRKERSDREDEIFSKKLFYCNKRTVEYGN